MQQLRRVASLGPGVVEFSVLRHLSVLPSHLQKLAWLASYDTRTHTSYLSLACLDSQGSQGCEIRRSNPVKVFLTHGGMHLLRHVAKGP